MPYQRNSPRRESIITRKKPAGMAKLNKASYYPCYSSFSTLNFVFRAALSTLFLSRALFYFRQT